jgi:phosphate transport system substrate-binding protein
MLLCSGPASAEQALTFSCSAQIAEAFGKDVIDEFEAKHDTRVDLYIGSSETALMRLVNGFSDLACIAFRLPSGYREKGYVEIPFARDPLAIIVAEDNPVQGLSRQQVRNVFTRSTQGWKALGGEQGSIVTVIPETGTAACRNFKRQVMKGFDVGYDFRARISTAVIMGVQHLPGAVSFISQGAAIKHESIKSLKIDGLSTDQPDYPSVQIFSFVTRGRPNAKAKEFVNAAFSERGQEIIRNKCMCPLTKNF